MFLQVTDRELKNILAKSTKNSKQKVEDEIEKQKTKAWANKPFYPLTFLV